MNESASDFEVRQAKYLNNKRVSVVEYSTFSKIKRVVLCEGAVFNNDATFNKDMETVLKSKGFPIVPYELEPGTIGCCDLNQKRGGTGRTLNGILVESAVTEADAAAISLGPYTTRIRSIKDVILWYNGKRLATVHSGAKPGVPINDDDNIETTLLYFGSLKKASKYNITAQTANNVFAALNEELVKIYQYYGGKDHTDMNNSDDDDDDKDPFVTNLLQYLKDLIRQISPTILCAIRPPNVATKYYNNTNHHINLFLTNTNTLFDNLTTQPTDNQLILKHSQELENIYGIIYKWLCSDGPKPPFILISSSSTSNKGGAPSHNKISFLSDIDFGHARQTLSQNAPWSHSNRGNKTVRLYNKKIKTRKKRGLTVTKKCRKCKPNTRRKNSA